MVDNYTSLLMTGPALMVCVVLGIATACEPSLLTVLVLILAGECEKVNSDLGLGSGFH